MRGILMLWLFSGLSAAGAVPQLEGRWKADCKPGFAPQTSIRPGLRFRGSRLAFTLAYFAGEGCAEPAYDYRWESHFSAGAEDPESLIAPIDFELRAIWVVPRSRATAEVFNAELYCGLGDWRVNGPKLVTGRKCDGNQLGVKGYRAYNVLRLKDERLELSPEQSVGNPEKRPQEPGACFYERS